MGTIVGHGVFGRLLAGGGWVAPQNAAAVCRGADAG